MLIAKDFQVILTWKKTPFGCGSRCSIPPNLRGPTGAPFLSDISIFIQIGISPFLHMVDMVDNHIF